MGNSWGTYTPKHCPFSQNFGITMLRQQIIQKPETAVFMRLQGIFYARFYLKTLDYESKGRRFESCRGHQKLKLTSYEVSFFVALFIFPKAAEVSKN